MIKYDCSSVASSGSGIFSEQKFEENYKKTVDALINFILGDSPGRNGAKAYIRDVEETQRKLERLVEGGNQLLQVVSDFDRTMSKYRHNGSLIPTCHGIFEMDPELTEEAKIKLKRLTEKYYPVEVDPNLSEAEKIPSMLDWWDLSHKTMVDCKLHRDALARTVKECGVVLREGVPDFTRLLHENDIPVLIFSAGIGNVIELLLQYFSLYTRNMQVVSNFMEFDGDGLLVGFSDPVIHSFNKNASSITNGHYARISSTRSCVLLLGDSTGDVHMADGATADDPAGVSGTVLRIGFLNESVESNLERYKSLYDIVLVDDDTFAVPIAIAQCVLKCPRTFANDNPIKDAPSS
ncbi:unnamed protein product [Calicophoron daubneyi]|uniref:5'-nucleotidase n=1 Tax=Calicophoron daubneyi TaxID=300641 RepID=A0AAV2U0F1_CALDB